MSRRDRRGGSYREADGRARRPGPMAGAGFAAHALRRYAAARNGENSRDYALWPRTVW